MKHTSIILLCLLALSACKTARMNELAATRHDQPVTTGKLSSLNGSYANKTSTGMVAELYSLWSRLFPRQAAGGDWAQARVTLQIADSATLVATLVRGDSILATNNIPFEVHKGYLRLQQRNYGEQLIGPLVWAWRNPEVYLGLSATNNLVLINGDTALLMILIIPTIGGGEPYAMEYNRS